MNSSMGTFLGLASRSREKGLAGGIVSSRASLLFDFSHSRQAVLSVAQPGLAALLALGGFPSLRIIGLGLVASTAGMLCVYASNDLLDLRVDREAVRSSTSPKIAEGYDIDVVAVRHPVAVGVLSLRLAIAWVVALGLIALGFAYWLRPGCALIFAGCVCLEVIYCALKRRTWLKTIPAGAMVGLGALAGWYAVRDFDLYALAFFFLLAFWEIFGRNLTNDLADVSHDAPARDKDAGHRARAEVVGPGESWAERPPSFRWRPCSRAVSTCGSSWWRRPIWTITLPALGLVRSPQEKEAQRMFNRASLFPPLAFVAALVFFAIRSATVSTARRSRGQRTPAGTGHPDADRRHLPARPVQQQRPLLRIGEPGDQYGAGGAVAQRGDRSCSPAADGPSAGRVLRPWGSGRTGPASVGKRGPLGAGRPKPGHAPRGEAAPGAARDEPDRDSSRDRVCRGRPAPRRPGPERLRCRLPGLGAALCRGCRRRPCPHALLPSPGGAPGGPGVHPAGAS